ncbi:PaaI family thioesterase [uncultured Maricaulis sp.]|uniref:PaaI family thioesterase n=1 Tax=uncultured Maricaulis sp. TaxID=174710 RepID=UPI0030DA5DAF|tara:strand:- start:7531 stop:7953 length:423 start_codon:yes stop_codon:yes gene_type:complete
MSKALIETLLAAPYVARFGVRLEQKGDELTGILPYSEILVGNPLIPALHGGAIGAFLEIVASASLLAGQSLERLPRPIDVAIDYLRPGRAADVYARAIVNRSGRRVANVRAEAWQGRSGAPVATLHGHFLITPSRSEPAD